MREQHGHGVDREVAPVEVFRERLAKLHGRLASGAVVRIAAIGRNFNAFAVNLRTDCSKVTADVPHGLSERFDEGENLLRPRRRREVEVVDAPAEKGIAHGSADKSDFVAGRLEGERQG